MSIFDAVQMTEEFKAQTEIENKTPVINKRPKRNLPPLINELIEQGLDVRVTPSSYVVYGFYGLNKDGGLIIFETNDPNVLMTSALKDKNVLLHDLKDVVKLNHKVWQHFYKKDTQYKRLNPLWADLFDEFNLLRYAPA